MPKISGTLSVPVAPVALLVAAVNERRERRFPADVQGADSFRGVKLVAGQGACTASQRYSTPREGQISAIGSTGKSTPVSLFAHISETTAVQ